MDFFASLAGGADGGPLAAEFTAARFPLRKGGPAVFSAERLAWSAWQDANALVEKVAAAQVVARSAQALQAAGCDALGEARAAASWDEAAQAAMLVLNAAAVLAAEAAQE